MGIPHGWKVPGAYSRTAPFTHSHLLMSLIALLDRRTYLDVYLGLGLILVKEVVGGSLRNITFPCPTF